MMVRKYILNNISDLYINNKNIYENNIYTFLYNLLKQNIIELKMCQYYI